MINIEIVIMMLIYPFKMAELPFGRDLVVDYRGL